MLSQAEKMVVEHLMEKGYVRLTKKALIKWIKSQKGNLMCVKNEYIRMLIQCGQNMVFEVYTDGRWITQECHYTVFWIQTRQHRDAFFISEE